MNVRINEEFKNVLKENGSVSIPGIGEIKTVYLPAKIDHFQGKITPPSVALQFHQNQILNDDRLVEYLRAKYYLTPEEAGQEMQYFISESLSTLEARQPLALPDIGRFFKDADLNIQFLPDVNTTNSDVFGLPEVVFSPISRLAGKDPKVNVSSNNVANGRTPQIHVTSERTYNAPIFPSVTNAGNIPTLEYVDASSRLPGRYASAALIKYHLPTVLPGAIMALLLALSAWIFLSKNGPEPTLDYKKSQKNMTHVNVKPVSEEASATAFGMAKNDPPKNDAINAQPIAPEPYIDKKETNAPERMEIAPPSPDAEKEAVALVGSFRKKENAERLAIKIQEAGFAPSSRKRNNVTIVNCSIPYTNLRDLHSKLARIRRLFGPEINLVKK